MESFIRRTVGSVILILSMHFLSPAISQAGYSDFPFASLSADVREKVVNQENTQVTGAGISFPAANEASGYRKTRIDELEVHAGVYDGWFKDSAHFVDTLFGAGIAILPVVGSQTVSDRFIAKGSDVKSADAHEIPAHASQLADWHDHDSVSYTVSGGIIFSVGAGFAMTGLSADYLARGDWTTYVEKMDCNKVYVKISKVNLSDFDLMAGNILVSEILSKFDKSDSYFSYTFDLSDERTIPAYEAMIHGTMKPAEVMAQAHPELVRLNLTEKGSTHGHQQRFFAGVPFLNFSHSSGRLTSFSDTVFHENQTRSDVDYGLYFSETNRNFFSKHSSNSTAYYGISYENGSALEPIVQRASGKYGKFILSFENDHSNAESVHDALHEMVQHTGLRDELALKSEVPSGKLDYTNLVLTVVISEAATQQLLSTRLQEQMSRVRAEEEVDGYFNHQGDPQEICSKVIPDDLVRCRYSALHETMDAADDMHKAIQEMEKANSEHRTDGFVRAYADFGRAMMRNGMAFNMIRKLLGGRGMEITFEAKGSQFSHLIQKVVVDQAIANGTEIAPEL